MFAEHWNPTVHSLADGVLKHYSERDADLYTKCLADYTRGVDVAQVEREKRQQQWEALIRSVGGP